MSCPQTQVIHSADMPASCCFYLATEEMEILILDYSSRNKPLPGSLPQRTANWKEHLILEAKENSEKKGGVCSHHSQLEGVMSTLPTAG